MRHQKWVAELIKDGKMDAAMKRAETLGRSGASYSNVWKAIKVRIIHFIAVSTKETMKDKK